MRRFGFDGANAMSIRAAIPASKRSRTVMIGESPVAFAMRLVENFSLGGRHGDGCIDGVGVGLGQCSAIETHAFARCSLHSLVTIYPRNATLKRQTLWARLRMMASCQAQRLGTLR